MSYLFDVFETRGISGNVYRFEIFSKWQRFEKNVSAVYAFLAQDEKNPYQLKIIYIGQSEDLDHRLTNHNKWSEAVKRGFSHLGVLRMSTSQLDSIERDLVRFHEPELNEVLYQDPDS